MVFGKKTRFKAEERDKGQENDKGEYCRRQEP
jgi:hypothetical protein